MPVLLRNLQQSVRINPRRLKRTAEAVLSAAHLENAELSFVLVSDQRIRALNARYRHKDRPTDVLAFPLREGPFTRFNGNLLGDVVISMPTAKQQAAEFGHSLHDELVRLLVHGLLHLLGYDHERSAQEAVRMARRERAMLRAIHEHE